MLEGFRVVELTTGVSAAWCARQFAFWGADVAMLEPAGGAPLRRDEPIVAGKSGAPHSLLFEAVAAGKRTLSLAALDAGARARLLAAADIFVTDYDDAALAALGLDLDALHAAHPGLCIVSVTPFGRTGPYAGWRGGAPIVEALSGYMSQNGDPDKAPLRAPAHLTAFASGVNAFAASLAALFKRVRTGWGDLVEATDLEAIAAFVHYLRPQYMHRERTRDGGADGALRHVRCADGWVSAALPNPLSKGLWQDIFGIADEDWPADLYEGEPAEVLAKTRAFLGPRFETRTAEQMFVALVERAAVSGMALSAAELLATEQLAERGFFRTLDHPELGPLRLAGPPGHHSASEPASPAPAPRLTDAVPVDALGWTPRPPGECDPARRAEPPLAGVRIIDVTQAWIGPYAIMILGDLGADVVKVEHHKRPDVWRRLAQHPPGIADKGSRGPNQSHYFNSTNRNKRSLSLNLQTQEGQALFKRLVAGADVVAENYTAHVMLRMGLDYEALREVNPALVMLSSSGFGKTGPWNDYRTNGSAIEGLAGWDALHGYPGGPPVLMGFYQADPICGLQLSAMILAMLLRREMGGGGAYLEGAMLEAGATYMADAFLEAQLGVAHPRRGNRDPNAAPSGVYPCAGDDRWIAIQCPDEPAWSALAAAIGDADLAGPDYATPCARAAAHDALDARIAAWTREHDAEALMARLQAAGVPAGAVRRVSEAMADPHFAARDWFLTLHRPDIGAHRHNGYAWRHTDAARPAPRPPPRLGEHSEAVLRDELGLNQAEIHALVAKEVTGAVV